MRSPHKNPVNSSVPVPKKLTTLWILILQRSRLSVMHCTHNFQ